MDQTFWWHSGKGFVKARWLYRRAPLKLLDVLLVVDGYHICRYFVKGIHIPRVGEEITDDLRLDSLLILDL